MTFSAGSDGGAAKEGDQGKEAEGDGCELPPFPQERFIRGFLLSFNTKLPLGLKVHEKIAAIVREEMEGAIQLDVPLKVDQGIGRSWYDSKGG